MPTPKELALASQLLATCTDPATSPAAALYFAAMANAMLGTVPNPGNGGTVPPGTPGPHLVPLFVGGAPAPSDGPPGTLWLNGMNMYFSTGAAWVQFATV